MTQYIDKSALMAEIENKIKKYTKRGEESDAKRDGYGMYWGGVLSCLNEIRTLCDTIEVKEVQEEPISEDLEKAAKKAGQKYFPNENNIWARPNYEAMAAANAFKEGYHWKEEQCQKTIELAEDHAYLAGQEKMIEKACEFIETYPHLFMGVIRSEVIEDFKNYMKGE